MSEIKFKVTGVGYCGTGATTSSTHDKLQAALDVAASLHDSDHDSIRIHMVRTTELSFELQKAATSAHLTPAGSDTYAAAVREGIEE